MKEVIKELMRHRYNDANMSDDVKLEVFAKRDVFVKEVHKNPKSKTSMDLYTVDTLSEAYESSYEVLNVMVGAMSKQSKKRFEKYTMQFKTSIHVSKVDEGYKVVAKYR